MRLYVKTQSKILGPLDWDRILVLHENGRLPMDATVSEDKNNWVTIEQVQQLIKQGSSESVKSRTLPVDETLPSRPAGLQQAGYLQTELYVPQISSVQLPPQGDHAVQQAMFQPSSQVGYLPLQPGPQPQSFAQNSPKGPVPPFPPQGDHVAPQSMLQSSPQGGYLPPQPGPQPQSFAQNSPKEPVPPLSFSYQRIGRKFYAFGDYSTLFALINEFYTRSGLKIIMSDINAGYIAIKYNYAYTHYVIFYQENDRIVIEIASNALCKFQFAIDRQLKKQKLIEIIEFSFYQYKSGQYLPKVCYNAILPQAFQKAEVDYTSAAKDIMWGGPLLTLVLPFSGFIIALIWCIVSLVQIFSTKSKKGQEFIYISFAADIVALLINIVIFSMLFN